MRNCERDANYICTYVYIHNYVDTRTCPVTNSECLRLTFYIIFEAEFVWDSSGNMQLRANCELVEDVKFAVQHFTRTHVQMSSLHQY